MPSVRLYTAGWAFSHVLLPCVDVLMATKPSWVLGRSSTAAFSGDAAWAHGLSPHTSLRVARTGIAACVALSALCSSARIEHCGNQLLHQRPSKYNAQFSFFHCHTLPALEKGRGTYGSMLVARSNAPELCMSLSHWLGLLLRFPSQVDDVRGLRPCAAGRGRWRMGGIWGRATALHSITRKWRWVTQPSPLTT
jgi:hypothetical protein